MLGPQDDDVDVPGTEPIEDEAFPPFPPPASPEGDGEGAEPDEGRSAPVPVPPKRTVRRNIPKLDAQRLVSERGLPALRRVFESAKFRGKGHEAADLKTLIRHMEHWAHRLFPKLQFEDFVDRVEYLGSKKEVQTCLKRIRLDLPIVHEDFVGSNEVDNEETTGELTVPEVDPFPASPPAGALFPSEPRPSLTDEQQQRIERNKRLALERRQAKLLSQSQPLGHDSPPTTPPVQSAEGTAAEGPWELQSSGQERDALDSPAAAATSPAHTVEGSP